MSKPSHRETMNDKSTQVARDGASHGPISVFGSRSLQLTCICSLCLKTCSVDLRILLRSVDMVMMLVYTSNHCHNCPSIMAEEDEQNRYAVCVPRSTAMTARTRSSGSGIARVLPIALDKIIVGEI
jgi:hypothetical protein